MRLLAVAAHIFQIKIAERHALHTFVAGTRHEVRHHSGILLIGTGIGYFNQVQRQAHRLRLMAQQLDTHGMHRDTVECRIDRGEQPGHFMLA